MFAFVPWIIRFKGESWEAPSGNNEDKESLFTLIRRMRQKMRYLLTYLLVLFFVLLYIGVILHRSYGIKLCN